MPEARSAFYTTSEQLCKPSAALEKLAPEYGFEVVAVGVTSASESGFRCRIFGL